VQPPVIRALFAPPLQKGLETREKLSVGGGMVLKEDISCLLIPPTPVRRYALPINLITGGLPT